MFCRHCGARTARTCAPYAHSCGPLGSRHGGDGGASQERSRHGHGLIVTIELNVMCRSRSVTKLRSLRTRVADDTPWDLGDRYRTVGGVGPLPDNFVPDLWRCIASSRAPHLAFDIPRRILQEYCEPILNKRSIKAVGRLWSYGWHIDRYGLRVAGPRYALSIDPRSLSKIDSEYSLNKRAVCAGKYQVPGVVVILRSRAPGARGSP